MTVSVGVILGYMRCEGRAICGSPDYFILLLRGNDDLVVMMVRVGDEVVVFAGDPMSLAVEHPRLHNTGTDVPTFQLGGNAATPRNHEGLARRWTRDDGGHCTDAPRALDSVKQALSTKLQHWPVTDLRGFCAWATTFVDRSTEAVPQRAASTHVRRGTQADGPVTNFKHLNGSMAGSAVETRAPASRSPPLTGAEVCIAPPSPLLHRGKKREEEEVVAADDVRKVRARVGGERVMREEGQGGQCSVMGCACCKDITKASCTRSKESSVALVLLELATCSAPKATTPKIAAEGSKESPRVVHGLTAAGGPLSGREQHGRVQPKSKSSERERAVDSPGNGVNDAGGIRGAVVGAPQSTAPTCSSRSAPNSRDHDGMLPRGLGEPLAAPAATLNGYGASTHAAARLTLQMDSCWGRHVDRGVGVGGAPPNNVQPIASRCAYAEVDQSPHHLHPPARLPILPREQQRRVGRGDPHSGSGTQPPASSLSSSGYVTERPEMGQVAYLRALQRSVSPRHPPRQRDDRPFLEDILNGRELGAGSPSMMEWRHPPTWCDDHGDLKTLENPATDHKQLQRGDRFRDKMLLNHHGADGAGEMPPPPLPARLCQPPYIDQSPRETRGVSSGRQQWASREPTGGSMSPPPVMGHSNLPHGQGQYNNYIPPREPAANGSIPSGHRGPPLSHRPGPSTQGLSMDAYVQMYRSSPSYGPSTDRDASRGNFDGIPKRMELAVSRADMPRVAPPTVSQGFFSGRRL